jgi:5-(carboxyamino)imidazole ribonucleotide synthase
MIAPGATIGIVGGGQLGRMLSMAAAQLGYRTIIFDPNKGTCAADVAAGHVCAPFDDLLAMEDFAGQVDVVTYEFENLPVDALLVVGNNLLPGTKSLGISQDRGREKQFIEASGARVAPWRCIDSLDDVRAAVKAFGTPIVLKTRRYGYDGKGQAWIRSANEAESAWQAIGQEPAVAEAGVAFDHEFSVILARTADGRHAFWDCPNNEHEGGILRRSTVPAPEVVLVQVDEARGYALRIAEALGHVGVLTVEFFASADGPVVNEIAPRVHNSGHWTIEGSVTSQFEQHIRAICGLPLGSTALAGRKAVMENLIGSDVDRWPQLIAEPGLHVHLYGKGHARAGRKMGHTTRVEL